MQCLCLKIDLPSVCLIQHGEIRPITQSDSVHSDLCEIQSLFHAEGKLQLNLPYRMLYPTKTCVCVCVCVCVCG